MEIYLERGTAFQLNVLWLVIGQTSAQAFEFFGLPPATKATVPNQYNVLIESDSTLSQHPSGNLAAVVL